MRLARREEARSAGDKGSSSRRLGLFVVVVAEGASLARGDVVEGRDAGPRVALASGGFAAAAALRRLPEEVEAALRADAEMCGPDVGLSMREAMELADRLDRGQAAAAAAALDDWRRAGGGDDNILESLGVATVPARGGARTFELASALLALRQLMAATQEELAARGGAAATPARVRTQAFQTAASMLLTGGARRQVDDDGAGDLDPAPYERFVAPRLSQGALDDVSRRGYAVVDGVLAPGEAAALRGELDALFRGGHLASSESEFQKMLGTRGDATGWVSAGDRGAGPRVAAAVELLYGVAARLRVPGLRVPPALMAARYPGPDEEPGAPYRGYRLHQDNEVLPGGGGAASRRRFTAILYANDVNWPDADGGHLVLYPGFAERPGDGDAGVAVAPKGGRLVVFDSFLWHEVRPANQPRYAITNWINGT